MITSNSNPKIVEIRKLNEAKFRKQTGLFLAEGLKAVGQTRDSKSNVETIVFTRDLLVSEFGNNLVRYFSELGNVEMLEVSAAVFESLARKDKPQGIAAVIHQEWSSFSEFDLVHSGLFVALESIQNPGNLGTILRTCDAVGANALILLNNSTDPYDPAAVKASMGSIFTVPIIKSTSDELLDWAKKQSLPIIGTSDKASHSCFDFPFPNPCLVLMGSEREGLPSELVRHTCEMVGIPMAGEVDSLNLSVATGIILYQVFLSHKTNRGKSS